MPMPEVVRFHKAAESSILNWRLASMGEEAGNTRAFILRSAAPSLQNTGLDVVTSSLKLVQEFKSSSSVWLSAWREGVNTSKVDFRTSYLGEVVLENILPV